MRSLAAVLSSLLLSSTVVFAQTGFTTKTFPAAGDTTLRVGDFNHDGKPDLLGYSTFINGGNIYLNDGSGGFKPPVALPPAGGLILQARIADMNGDGYPDIVTCSEQSSRSSQQNYLVIYLNDGSGNFTAIQTTPIIGQCGNLVVGDVNLDGHQDVVVASYTLDTTAPYTRHNDFETFFGDGTGKVGAPVTVSNINLDVPSAQYGGDVNCAVADIVGGNFYLDNQLSLIVNTHCSPSFATPQQFGTTFLAHGDGTGHFTFTQSNVPNAYLVDGQNVDLNVDGRPDGIFIGTVSPGNTNLYTAINNGSGNFTYKSMFNTDGYYGLTSADFNGDGIPDLAASYISSAAYSSQNYGPGTIRIYDGSKHGTYTTSQSFNVGGTNSLIGDLVSADFNGDGKPDLATVVTDRTTNISTLYVYTNTQGSGSACTVPTTANSNIICAPAKGATVASPVTITAASNVAGFTLNRLYLDNKSVYQTATQTVNTSLTTTNGSHTLVLVSYNNKGQAFSSSNSFTVSSTSTSCLPSSGPGAIICSPDQGSSSTSPITLTAGVIAQSGNITAIRAYIDNAAVLTVNNTAAVNYQQISQPVSVTAGAHRLVIVGYQSNGGSVTTSVSFTALGASNCYPPTAGASICSPTNGSTMNSPFTLTAGATAGSGFITAIRAYLDSVAKSTIFNPKPTKSFTVSTLLTAAPGKHTLTVVGYQSTGGSVSTVYTINVQ